MSPVTALLLGFTFSFAWTPCVGPALASVLIMAASAGTRGWAFVLIGCTPWALSCRFWQWGCSQQAFWNFSNPYACRALHGEGRRRAPGSHGGSHADRADERGNRIPLAHLAAGIAEQSEEAGAGETDLASGETAASESSPGESSSGESSSGESSPMNRLPVKPRTHRSLKMRSAPVIPAPDFT